jgi:DNA gyrase subunit A
MHQLSQGAYEGYKVRREELKKEIRDTEAILDDDAQLDEIIIDQLKEGIKLFGGPRRSGVVKDDEEEIPEGDHILAVSKDGYIKKVALDNRTIGQVGNFGGNYMTTKVSNLDNIFIFDSRGMVTKLSVNNIPDMVIKDIGVPVERFIPNCGKIVSALVEPTKADRKKLGKDLFITFLSKTGYVKKTNLDEFANISGSATAIKLPANDELIDTIFTTDNTRKDMIIYTNKGNGIRRDINEFSVMKANAHGSRQLVLADGEYCVGFNKIDPEKKYLFYMTSSGRAKLTETKYFPAMKKTDDVLSLINLEKSETLVTILSVNKKDKVVVYRKNNQPETISASDVPVLTRAAKAEKIVKTPKGDCVLSCAVIIR